MCLIAIFSVVLVPHYSDLPGSRMLAPDSTLSRFLQAKRGAQLNQGSFCLHPLVHVTYDATIVEDKLLDTNVESRACGAL